ncbi:MAG: hypothetical protein D6729_14685 [Deltaproteobacteria bacterium]|nr:MAG: hypothetical protein D6729_14685 [Deltaproteobacteria bacterium]
MTLPRISPQRTTSFGLVLLAALLPLSAAAEVYLNGVDITGVRNQTFENATVRIDAQGNVHIDAPGYAVAGAAPGGAASGSSTGQVEHKYYLVTSQNAPGATQYDIDVYINAKWVRTLRNDEDQIVADITRFLRPGENRILLVARKNIQGGRKSHSAGHYFRVIVGRGNEGGNNVMIERALVDFKRTAADMDDVSKEFRIRVD